MTKRFELLDYGYLELVEHWGSDERIVESARMSTGKGFLGWESGPCEECAGSGRAMKQVTRRNVVFAGAESLTIGASSVAEEQAPIMVFREWHRHRTQSYNEMSARYTPLPDLNYSPTPDRCLPVGRYSRMRASTVLRNWLAFMTLRSERTAQHEIRVYSDAVGRLVEELFPRTWQPFAESRSKK